ncbi:MaoC/PaaZ C-terminal domain-containing protein [Streptomyces sp. NPDC026673]|uniref:MaoC/PaaZ C-terminal domain-containing protein n=1 Tax=Streptomyces sp. NPDC026673 TaxID=3155724 RepID=UPI0033FF9AE5
MPLLLTLAKGVLTGVGKRPDADAPLPADRPGAPAVRVDPDRLAAYAAVCGFRRSDRLPLTYPHILGFPLAARLMADRRFPLPLLGLVHTSIEIVQRRPIPPGERPGITVRAEGLRPHRRGVEAVIVTEALIDGEVVWADRSGYLARTRGNGTREGGTSRRATDREATGSGSPALGSEAVLPTVAEWRLPADLGRRHASVSGDWNPIHVHPLTARPFGFPRAIAHGMWTVARCAAEAVPEDAEEVTLRAEFKAPVLLPATVSYAAASGAFAVRSGDRLHLSGTVELPPRTG